MLLHIQCPPAVDGLAPCQEAAVLYAQDQAQEAVAVLEQAIRGNRHDRDAWLLLLALHRARYDVERFEALAERFVAQFDGPAPGWLPEFVLRALPPEMHPSGSAYVELMGELADPDPRRFDALHARCARHAVVHLDATRIDALDPDSAHRLSLLLRALAGDGTGLFISGAQRLAATLQTRLKQDPTLIAYWTLLLDLYRLQDREAEFERAGLECALHTGTELPQWHAIVLPVLHAHPVLEKRSEPRYGGPETLSLCAVVESAHDPQFARLQRQAEDRQYVNVDLSGLTRIAPVAAQGLIRLTAAWLAQGKTVRLLRPSPLVETLFSALSLDPRIQLIRAQLA